MEAEATSVEITAQNAQTVLDGARDRPVLLLLWAEPDLPSKDLKDEAERVAARFQGKFLLAHLDLSREQALGQQLAQQLQVRALPSLRLLVDGQIADQMDGPMDGRQLEAWLEPHLLSGLERLRAVLDQVLERRDFDQAAQLLQQAIRDEPTNVTLRVELADVLARAGRTEDAESMLAGVPEDAEGRDRPAERLALRQELTQYPDVPTLEARLEDPRDLEARYQLAVHRLADEAYEPALDLLLEILRTDRTWEDDLGRRAMLRAFAVMGKGHPLSSSYRRRMFNFMH